MDIIGIGQLVVAAGSFFVAYSVARSDKQIKELIKLTVEQKRQSEAQIAMTEILIKNLGLTNEKLKIDKQIHFKQKSPFLSGVVLNPTGKIPGSAGFIDPPADYTSIE